MMIDDEQANPFFSNSGGTGNFRHRDCPTFDPHPIIGRVIMTSGREFLHARTKYMDVPAHRACWSDIG